jgi:hypothetical protein
MRLTHTPFVPAIPAFAGTGVGIQSREGDAGNSGSPAFAKASAGQVSGVRRSPKGEDGPLSRGRTEINSISLMFALVS